MPFNSFPQPKPDSGGSNIKSKQSGSVTWASTTITLDIPISAVDPNKSIVRISMFIDAANLSTTLIAPEILNGTTIRLNRVNGADLTGNSLHWEVIEYNNVKSKQTGIATGFTAGTEKVIPVSSVVTNKSILFTHQTSSATTTASSGSLLAGTRIISPTSIGITTSASNTSYWQLIEFY